jgi:hypothetical protein
LGWREHKTTDIECTTGFLYLSPSVPADASLVLSDLRRHYREGTDFFLDQFEVEEYVLSCVRELGVFPEYNCILTRDGTYHNVKASPSLVGSET